MQLAAQPTSTTASAARYGGYLDVPLPEAHPKFSWGYEDPQAPRAVIVPMRGAARTYDSVNDAIAAARRLSAGARPALAVTRTADGARFAVEQLLVKAVGGRPSDLPEDKYSPIDLQALKLRKGVGSLWQPLQSQRQVLVERVVDGNVTLEVHRYQSAKPAPIPPAAPGTRAQLTAARDAARAGIDMLERDTSPEGLDLAYDHVTRLGSLIVALLGTKDLAAQHQLVTDRIADAGDAVASARAGFENLDVDRPIVTPIADDLESARALLADALHLLR